MGSPITVHSSWKITEIKVLKDFLEITIIFPYGDKHVIIFRPSFYEDDMGSDTLTLNHNITFRANPDGSTISTEVNTNA